MRWMLMAATICGIGCADVADQIDLPFVDIGNDYECTVDIECDGEAWSETHAACAQDGQDLSNALWGDCVNAMTAGCAQWACSASCSGAGYCSL